MWLPWNLSRNPLVPSVPLDGTDSVQGLRTLERLRAAELLDTLQNKSKYKSDASIGDRHRTARRRRYQRYKGPFVEYSTLEDLKRDPRPWKDFSGHNSSGRGDERHFDVPACLDLLAERIDENLVYFLGNYMRVSLGILIIVTYLRPRSIIGILMISYNVYIHYDKATRAQRETGGEEGRNDVDANKTMIWTVITWIAMIYSKCMPIISLAFLISLATVLLHASLKRSTSEMRYRGKKPISYSFRSVYKGLPRESRTLFKECKAESLELAMHMAVSIKRWTKYFFLFCIDSVRKITQSSLQW